MSVTTALVAGGGGVAVALIAAVVYRDAVRVGVDLGSPAAWAALVALTGGASLVTLVLVPDAPLPGVLVLTALGPLLYLLERDDSMNGNDAADPTRLPSQSGDATDRSDDRDP
ncbi:hypothetical protein C463_12547 [Halorubrum californiense DSM 19288]|uniref:Integral membrane protein n=1 Tax=Halorubrum californiense DSM 19288 TaxID=1227465 RepID=M0E188_9EURY|nr:MULTISPECIES: hypothetical protein [Halorubrum]ELZ41511.1 hypothetical protein C463_12547 [Halorubrum californiense DSM 19288]TKX70352.1 hypothetical protein EXE40_09555 [Halorubrum sp. GN11GM_10-3_MGM]